jgi:hypothetical protein
MGALETRTEDTKLNRLALAAAVLCIPLAGCEFNMPGTTAAYAECYGKLTAQGLETSAAKGACVAQNQAAMQDTLERNAHTYMGGVQLYISNTMTNHVVTSYRVTISTDNGKRAVKVGDGKFLQPGQTDPMFFAASELNGMTSADMVSADGKTTWYVDVQATNGLEIKAGIKF